MTRTFPALIGVAFLSFATMSHADDAPINKDEQVKIPFANHGGIYDWQADGEKGLYINGRSHDWYYATVMSPCPELPWARTIGFKTEPTDEFDKFSSLLVEHRECKLTSLTRSDAPPKGKK